jgi:thiosulfate reductase cytochrome b subunit
MKLVLYPLSIRIWHWANALAMLVLILTGVQLRFPEHVPLLPDLRTAVRVHNLAGLAIAACWLAWLGVYLVRRELLRQYLVRPRDLGEPAARQVAHYAYGVFQGWPAPFHPRPEAKFNPLQKVTYAVVMFVMLPAQALTGLLLWDLARFEGVIEALGGVRVVDAVHVLLAYAFVAFLMAHVYLSTLGATFLAHFKAMVLGYEEEAEPEAAPLPPQEAKRQDHAG